MEDKLCFGKSGLTRYSRQYSQALMERTYRLYKITDLFSRCPPFLSDSYTCSASSSSELLNPEERNFMGMWSCSREELSSDLGMGQAQCTVWSQPVPCVKEETLISDEDQLQQQWNTLHQECTSNSRSWPLPLIRSVCTKFSKKGVGCLPVSTSPMGVACEAIVRTSGLSFLQ